LIQRLASSQRSIRSRQVSVEKSKLALSSAQIAYKNGTIDLSRLLDAEMLFLRSQVEFLTSTALFYESLSEWERLNGQSSDQFLIFSESEIQKTMKESVFNKGEIK
ncbi:MAG: TolC family protein, partial [Leptonema sp. (in: Bacteria)]|nr:TolC family protein [Leptonema sp. (in: bacteria)]